VVLVLGALGFRDRKETDVLQLICSVSLIAKRSGFPRTKDDDEHESSISELTLNWWTTKPTLRPYPPTDPAKQCNRAVEQRSQESVVPNVPGSPPLELRV
jgi:hypothetical protein